MASETVRLRIGNLAKAVLVSGQAYQDPKDALVPSMPQSALRNVKVNHCLPLSKIGALLVRLATTRNVGLAASSAASMRSLPVVNAPAMPCSLDVSCCAV